MTTPDNPPDQSDRDHAGRFAPGCQPGPGRPQGSRAFDLRAIARDKAAAEGLSLEGALWEIVSALITQAKAGDVRAAQVLLDRLVGREPLPVVVDDPHDLGDALRRARLRLAARDEQEAGA